MIDWSVIREKADEKFACDCSQKRVVYTLARNGTKMWSRQCPQCGTKSTWIAQSTLTEDEKAVATERDFREGNEWLDARQRYELQLRDEILLGQRLEADKEVQDYRARYLAYLASATWRMKRAGRLALDLNTCQAKMRGCRQTASQVHHLTYDNLGDEPLWDLQSVCRNCHERIEAKKRGEIDFLEEVL